MDNQQAREGIRRTLRKLIASGVEPDMAAQRVLQVEPVEALRAFVLPIVRSQAQGIKRDIVRDAERRAFQPNTAIDDAARETTSATSDDYRKALLDEGFVLPNGDYVTWGAATAEQHRQRADWSRDHASNMLREAERHEIVAKIIDDQPEASCLNDVEGWESQLDAYLAA